MKFASSQTDVYFQFNLGSDHATVFPDGIDRCIIPADHNFTSMYVQADNDVSFGSPTALHATLGSPDTGPTAGTLIDLEFDTATSSERYIRVHVLGTATFEVSQIVLTKINTLGVAPDLRDSVDEKRDNFVRLVQPQGISPTVQLGPQQRFVQYSYDSPLSGGDLTKMEAMIDSVGMVKPLFVDPASFSTPPETDEPVLWMKFEVMPQVANSILVPKSNDRSKTFTLSLIESVD